MTGPVDGPIDARVEWYYDGGWQDVSDDVDMRSEITVTYGQPDEHGESESTDINMVMRNENAQCSPEDPAGSRYGKIGLGTLMRVRIGDPQPLGGLVLPGEVGSYASTADTGVLDITGDIDVRLDLNLGGKWLVLDEVLTLASKLEVTGDQISWALYFNASQALWFTWSPDGTNASRVTVTSTEGVPADSGRLAVRVTLDVDNGAGGNTATFYTAETIAGPWTQLGDPVVTAGITSIHSGTALVELGSGSGGVNPFGGNPLSATIYGFELRNGIGGTVVANPDFTGLPETQATFAYLDPSGLTWFVNGNAKTVVRDPSIRGTAAAVSYTPGWDETGLDAQMAVRGAGILERLGHGREPLRSPLVYDLSTAATTVAYWPLEDGAQATTVAAAVGGQPLTVTGDVTMAGYDGFAGSGPVPTFGNGAHISGTVPAYVPDARQRLACMLHQPDSPSGDRNLLYGSCTGGSVADATLVLKGDGSLRIVLRDSIGTSLLDFSGGVSDLRGENAMVWMLLTQVGPNIDWQIGKIAEGDNAITFHTGTLNSHTYGRFTTINIGSDGDLSGTAVGHVHIVNGDDSAGLWVTAANSLVAWVGELAGHRINRLCRQESVPCLIDGAISDTEQVGPQGVDQLLTILDSAAAVDGGPWGERRDAYSLLYRTRESLYRQAPTLILDMADGAITASFSPPLDTQSVRNDVTVTRDNGSSFRAVQLTGPLSILDPPDGIGGSYPSSPPLNLYGDHQVADQATWRLHLGTTPGHRVSRLEIEMHHHPELVQAVLELRNGDLVRVLNTPAGLPPGPLDLIVLGTADTIGEQTWHVTLNCAPGAPWQVAAVSDGSDEERVDTDGSTVGADFVAGTDTTLSVATGWFEDFENDQYAIPASPAGVAGITGTWARTDTTAHTGSWSLGSPVIGHTQQADAVVQIPAGATQVGFWYRVSSEAGFDFFRVYVDGVQVLEDSGDSGWVEVAPGTFSIVGAQELTFRYFKDVSESALLDGAFIDDLSFVTGQPLWTTDPDQFPLEIQASGVVLQVTAVSGASSPQTFTVAADPVNGITKTIPAGTDVRLAVPPIIGL